MGLGGVRRWYRNASLRAKFAVHVVLSTALLFGALLPVVLYIQTTALLSAATESGFRVAKMFARSSVQAVVADDYLIMQHVVNGIGSERKVRYAMLLKDTGEVLVHTKAMERGHVYADPMSIAAVRAPGPLVQRFDAPDGTPVYDFSVPVFVLGERRATARVAFSIADEWMQIAQTRNYIVVLGLAVLALGVVWASFEAGRVVRPVEALVGGTQEIARGNLDHRIPVTTGDELGQLGAAFNRMTESIQALLETSRQLGSTLDPDAVLRSVASYALDLVKADIVAIAPFDRRLQQARVQVAIGAHTEGLERLVVTPGRGIGGFVIATGRPATSTSYASEPGVVADEEYDAMCAAERIETAATVPITLRGTIVGLLWVANRRPIAFTREDVDALDRMAHQAAIALENARLYAETRVKGARLESLVRVSRAMTSTLDPERILDIVLRALTELVEGVAARLWVPGAGTHGLVPLGAGAEGIAARTPVERLIETVAVTREPLIVADLRADHRVLRTRMPSTEGEDIVGFLGLPLVHEDRLVAVLEIATSAPCHFSEDEIELFASFGQQAAIALENARLYHELKASNEELVAAQEALVNETRMAAMGHIAAVVAHEARNPLGALSNCVQMLRTNPNITGEDHELLGIMHTEAARLNTIVSDFLTFGRPREPELVELDIHELVQATMSLLRRDDRCPASVHLIAKLDPSTPPIVGDRDQLRQVLWNLVINAVQAMPEGGEVRIETVAVGDRVEISVSDTGPGMPPAVMARIFEPFFTTRSGGTGLGLAIVKRIVDDHRGRISVASEQGQGTCFTLSLISRPAIA